MLVQQNHELQLQASGATKSEEAHKSTTVFLQAQVNILKQKLEHKKRKHQDTLGRLQAESQAQIKELQAENRTLTQQLNQASTELAHFHLLNKKVHLKDNPNYEDRVRQLLADLESQSNDHIKELNAVHDQYRAQAAEDITLREKVKQQSNEASTARDRERELRMQLTKV